jgi:hypothetical protein
MKSWGKLVDWFAYFACETRSLAGGVAVCLFVGGGVQALSVQITTGPPLMESISFSTIVDLTLLPDQQLCPTAELADSLRAPPQPSNSPSAQSSLAADMRRALSKVEQHRASVALVQL